MQEKRITVTRINVFFLVLFTIALTVIFISTYFLITSSIHTKKMISNVNSAENPSCNNIHISFTIDDISFSKDQKPILENALFLARKYNVTIDLGIIAQQFSQYADPETLKIYQDNKDVFEVFAHGFNHQLDTSETMQNPTSYGEFMIIPSGNLNPNQSLTVDISKINITLPVPYYIQEQKIKRMFSIFYAQNLTMATKIFVVPYHGGDESTITLAQKYGYKLIIEKLTVPKNWSEEKDGNIIASQDYVDITLNNIFTPADVSSYVSEVNAAINMGQKDIYLTFHPVNFQILKSTDYFFNAATSIKNINPKINFDMMSQRLNC